MQGEYWIEKLWNGRQSSWFNWTFYADKYWNYNQFIVSSFDWNAAAGCLLNSAIRIGVLTEERFGFGFRQIYSGTLNSSWLPFINCRNTAKLQEKIPSFPLDSERTRRPKIKSFNVNGIISDFPDRIWIKILI
jgi:glycerophosphoryl diester phosphodiesterase